MDAYRVLLKKYMSIVIDREGVSYADEGGSCHPPIELTSNEQTLLNRIEDEIINEE